MRAMFGVVSLLIALAIVGVLASRQLKAVNRSVSTALPATTPPADGTAAPPANVREQSRQLQQRVAADVGKALEQGASRTQDADK